MATEPYSLDRLRRAALGGDPEIERGEAFALLAASEYPERVEILAAILADRGEPAVIRAAAAIALGRIATAEAERALLDNLGSAEPRVQSEILRSLGRIGGERSLAAIEALEIREEDPRAEAARFAAALLAHRFRLPGHDLPFPDATMLLPTPEKGVREVRFSPVGPEEMPEILEGLRRQPYGIEYDTASFLRFDCGGETDVICLNRDFTSPEGIGSLLERKALAGVVVLKSPETGMYSVSYLLLTSPEERVPGLRILAPRCSGKPALAGTARGGAERLDFSLRAVDRSGARPVEVEGSYVAGQIATVRAVAGIERVRVRRPAFRPQAAARNVLR